jgi:hypothetical protein
LHLQLLHGVGQDLCASCHCCMHAGGVWRHEQRGAHGGCRNVQPVTATWSCDISLCASVWLHAGTPDTCVVDGTPPPPPPPLAACSLLKMLWLLLLIRRPVVCRLSCLRAIVCGTACSLRVVECVLCSGSACNTLLYMPTLLCMRVACGSMVLAAAPAACSLLKGSVLCCSLLPVLTGGMWRHEQCGAH